MFDVSLKKNRIICAVFILLALGISTSFASTNTFQATVVARSEPQILESQALHFGNLSSFVGASCILDSDGNQTGNCDNDNNQASPATISITGLSQNAAVSLNIVGSSSGNLSVIPSGLASIEGVETPLTAGVPVNLVSGSAGIELAVFGQVQVVSGLETGQAYQVDYTVEVNFQ